MGNDPEWVPALRYNVIHTPDALPGFGPTKYYLIPCRTTEFTATCMHGRMRRRVNGTRKSADGDWVCTELVLLLLFYPHSAGKGKLFSSVMGLAYFLDTFVVIIIIVAFVRGLDGGNACKCPYLQCRCTRDSFFGSRCSLSCMIICSSSGRMQGLSRIGTAAESLPSRKCLNSAFAVADSENRTHLDEWNVAHHTEGACLTTRYGNAGTNCSSRSGSFVWPF